MTRAVAWAALTLSLGLGGCGHKGDPLPPLRHEPRAAQDLSVHQQGELLILRFAYPNETVSGGAVPGLDSVEIWDLRLRAGDATLEGVNETLYARNATKVATLAGGELASAIAGDRIEARIRLDGGSGTLEPGEHLLAVRTRSTSGELSAFSNRVALSLASPSPPPRGLLLEAREDGVYVEWQEPEPQGETTREPLGYLVYRREATERVWGNAIGVVTDGTSYLDRDARFGIRYVYTVRAATSREPLVESAAAVEREIFYRDRFPPAPPARLLALPEPGRVRLALSPSPSPDAVAYHIYRRDPGAEFRRITRAPLEQLEMVDSGLTPGLTYTYRASAVDSSGNEGAPGDDVTVTLADEPR